MNNFLQRISDLQKIMAQNKKLCGSLCILCVSFFTRRRHREDTELHGGKSVISLATMIANSSERCRQSYVEEQCVLTLVFFNVNVFIYVLF